MKKTKFRRLAALLLCLIFVVGAFSVNAAATDGEAGANGETTDESGTTGPDYSIDDMIELLGTISYDEYVLTSDFLRADAAKQTVRIDAVNDLIADESDADYVVGEYEGIAAIEAPGDGTLTWSVNVPETARYTITIVFYTIDDGKASSIERVFGINGSLPFSEARYLTIKKNWVNDYEDAIYAGKDAASVKAEAENVGLMCNMDGDELKIKYPAVWTSDITDFCDKYDIRFATLDLDKNELRPSASQTPTWSEYTMIDSTGFHTEAFEFVLTEGENTISLEGKNGTIAISEIILSPAEDVLTYKEYADKYAGKPEGSGTIKIEAEYTDAASDKTIYPIEDSASALTSPHDASRTVLNTIGGGKWQNAGQWVTYKFRVEKSGMYELVFRFKQDVLDGMFVSRTLSLYSEGLAEGADGYYNGVPFEEARNITYNYGDNWQVTSATAGETAFSFYFEEGTTYTLKLEVTLGDMADIINTVQSALDHINDDYLTILQLTGTEPDNYRDYGFSRIIPDTLKDMALQAIVLDNEEDAKNGYPVGVAQRLTELAGQKSSNVGTLQKVADILKDMSSDEDEIASSLERLKTYIGTLGTFLSDAQTQPLQLDYILVQPAEEKLPKANANFFASFGYEISRFFWSFFRDYDHVGAMEETTDESLEVWLATGRDQFQVIRSLINSDFTSVTGYTVELKLVAGGTLLPSILANQGPDVYHGMGQSDVINYAIRSAILPIEGFEDFDTVKTSFNDAAMLVLGLADAEGTMHYYGLPEQQGFAMMFVRIDILAELGESIPETWDDLMSLVPKLQAKNMEIGLTTDTYIHLYQAGGQLYADDGMRVNLNSKLALTSFAKMCKYFTDYGFPYTYNAANRFRTGEMPILIGDYTGLYNQLKVFATEIEGKWVMVPVPGTLQADGTVNNCAVSSVNASVLVKGSEDKADAAWAYLKWFTGPDCQIEYSNEMVAIMGPSAKHNTANIEALASLPWTTDEYSRIKAQFDNLASIPNYPGSYIIDRYLGFAFLAAYNDGEGAAQALLSYVPIINKEITRKRAEFGLETLEGYATLAEKRCAQAKGVAEMLANKDKSYDELEKKVNSAIRSEDSVTLNALADDVLEMVEGDYSNTIKISTSPDTAKMNEDQLLYYLAQALMGAADALDSY